MFAPIAFTDNVVTTVIDTECWLEIFFQITTTENVCINEVDVIAKADSLSLLAYPPTQLFIILAIKKIE